MSIVYEAIKNLNFTKEEKNALRTFFISNPNKRAEAELILPTCDDEEVVTCLKNLLKPDQSVGTSYDKDLCNNIGDELRNTFPHIKETAIKDLTKYLAIIWKHSQDIEFRTPVNLYAELNESPLIFKSRIPYGIYGDNFKKIDLYLPPYKANSEINYENPLYQDSQFQETVNLVKKKIDSCKHNIIVLAGVSGGGKTSTTFAIAAERWGIHIDCSPQAAFYGNHLHRELSEIRAINPTVKDTSLQNDACKILDIALLSRGLLLIKMLVQKKIQTPKDWLLAQLQGLMGLNLISRNLSEQNLKLVDFHILLQHINKCLKIEQLLFIQDEAQVLCRPEYGEYFGSTTNNSWNLLQGYTNHMLTGFPVTHIISGTNMHMLSGVSLVTSVGKYSNSHIVQVVLKLPYLTPDDILRNLNNIINMDGVSPSTLRYLGSMLKGRPRNCAAFIKLLTNRPRRDLSKDEEMVKTIELWYKDICNTMVKYLSTTAETLGPKINPEKAIVDILCFRVFYTSDYQHAIKFLQNGILPTKSPDCISLTPQINLHKTTVEINLELESYFVNSIEMFLMQRGKTLVDVYVENISCHLQYTQSIGSELNAAFATSIIQKHDCNVREELAKWMINNHFDFPEWITPEMQFVTDTNLSNSISLYDYIEDAYSQSPKYHNHVIQPEHVAGSDLVLSLVDEFGNLVLLSLSSTISDKSIPRKKVKKQAFKACLEFQYMEEIRKTKRPNDEEIQRSDHKELKKSRLLYKEKRCVEIGLDKPSELPQVESHVKTLLAANIEDEDGDGDGDDDDDNFDLNYNENLKSYRVSKTTSYAELNKKIKELMSFNGLKRKCIHVLVELPRRLASRPDIFRYDNNSNLIIIVDDRNVEQVFGEKMAKMMKSLEKK